MTIRWLVRVACMAVAALFMMAVSASASTVSYTTNASGTEFTSDSSLTLHQTSGDAATIVFTPNTTSNTGVPSFINLGDFEITCASCTTSSDAVFGAFTFDLVIDDTTDGATGEFVGSSSGGTVYSNSSTVSINWVPLILGPGTTHALTGNFGTTEFTTTTVTNLAAPNSGTPPGDTTVQGGVTSSALPEPATLSLVCGGLLLGFGVLRRRRRSGK